MTPNTPEEKKNMLVKITNTETGESKVLEGHTLEDIQKKFYETNEKKWDMNKCLLKEISKQKPCTCQFEKDHSRACPLFVEKGNLEECPHKQFEVGRCPLCLPSSKEAAKILFSSQESEDWENSLLELLNNNEEKIELKHTNGERLELWGLLLDFIKSVRQQAISAELKEILVTLKDREDTILKLIGKFDLDIDKERLEELERIINLISNRIK